MITVKPLDSEWQLDEAAALLYKTYVLLHEWSFGSDNPSNIRIEIKNGRKILVDRLTKYATWFGAFDDDKLIGCIRLCSIDENSKLELEYYESTYLIQKYLPGNKSECFELTKLTVEPKYIGRGIVKKLLKAAFQYCENNHYSVISCTHNGYLKSLFDRIGNPLKIENAFKYEPQDVKPVNFYFADYENSDITNILKSLRKVEFNEDSNGVDLLKALEISAPLLPAPVYWHDTDGVVLGINAQCLNAIGKSREIIGKSPYDFYPEEIAAHILNHNAQVIKSGETLWQEESINDVHTGKPKYFVSIKSPLYADDGKVIGIVGTSVDITAEKEAEKLRRENERLEFENHAQQLVLNEQKKFREIVGQVNHDIKSPLSSLQMLTKQCSSILPEKERNSYRNAIARITDIANNMMNYFKHETHDDQILVDETQQTMLVSTELIEILTEKKYEYSNKAINFISNFSQDGNFAFINVQSNAFKRMISNIINNSVDAIEKKEGKISINLDSDGSNVKILIQDNGKGMPPEIKEKILNNISITAGKQDGHGIGLTQVRETLQINNGELNIESKLGGGGTEIILNFPRVANPDWIAEEIRIAKDDIIIILDDDSSIHGAWDLHFGRIKDQALNLTINHFENGKDAIIYINNLSPKQKEKVFLLTDYELLKQELNGLEVVEHTNIKRSILVTSHYNDKLVRDMARKTDTKILPKQLASEVPININEGEILSKKTCGMKSVDMIIVDDDKNFVQCFCMFAFGKAIDTYHSPIEFLDNVSQYPKDTKICLDNNFDICKMRGLDIAKQLYELGYTKLYIISGQSFEDGAAPSYVTIILKTDIDSLKKI